MTFELSNKAVKPGRGRRALHPPPFFAKIEVKPPPLKYRRLLLARTPDFQTALFKVHIIIYLKAIFVEDKLDFSSLEIPPIFAGVEAKPSPSKGLRLLDAPPFPTPRLPSYSPGIKLNYLKAIFEDKLDFSSLDNGKLLEDCKDSSHPE